MTVINFFFTLSRDVLHEGTITCHMSELSSVFLTVLYHEIVSLVVRQ